MSESENLAQRWAAHFGLALSPLFDTGETVAGGHHAVLLDGGFGSFAMSETDEELWRSVRGAAWAWSSNLPHHVTVTSKVVAVTRWDKAEPEVLSRTSVEGRLESFYSYLIADRVRSNQRVVEHVLGLFRRVRSLVADARLTDDRSVDAFLGFLALLIERDRDEGVEAGSRSLRSTEAQRLTLRQLSQAAVNAMLDEVRSTTSMQTLRLHPSLAIRHAGSEIFQEAHFEFLRAPGLDLFDFAGPAEVSAVSRGGAHFTPPALARSLVEQTLLQIEGLHSRRQLVVMDPACGSGAFLQEAVRTLGRLKFVGHLVLVGRDISSAAISMAGFVCQQAVLDYNYEGGVSIDLKVADSMRVDLPKADVILMNPPFIAWSALNPGQRDDMRTVLGEYLQGRGDFSMAFITMAIALLEPGGALGALMPSSLLTLQAAEAWRANLLERVHLRLLASLGDYGLFAHALVQVAAAVFAKPAAQMTSDGITLSLVSGNTSDSTGEALRFLRQAKTGEVSASRREAWEVFEVPTATLRQRPTWRVISPTLEAGLTRLMDSGAERIGALFDVRQGIRTGDNKVFLLTEEKYHGLPTKERKYFRPAVMNDSIQDGLIQDIYYVFYPSNQEGPLFATEDELMAAVPCYADRYLIPRAHSLKVRAGHVRAGRADWWGLSWGRESWAQSSEPRLISKYFGGPGGFVVDAAAKFAVVQGFAWFLKRKSASGIDEDLPGALTDTDILFAFAGLMNSGVFAQLLELFSPHVAGGQVDLSPRYVNAIPIPNLLELEKDARLGRLIKKLSSLARTPRLLDANWTAATDRISSELYGGDFLQRI